MDRLGYPNYRTLIENILISWSLCHTMDKKVGEKYSDYFRIIYD